MADLFAHKVYLRSLSDPRLVTHYSVGAQRRAAQVQGFLRALQEGAAGRFPLASSPDLLVLSREDWRRLLRHPYGLPLTRGASVIAAADNPERLLRRFDPVLLRAGQQGLRAPGELREYLDLLVGLEWAHAVLPSSGLKSRLSWLNELTASLLLLLALEAAGYGGARERLLRWARLGLAGSGLESAPLSLYAYPRSRMNLASALVLQDRFFAFAERLEPEGWKHLLALSELLAKERDREALIARLKALEPRFGGWLADFGDEVS